MSTLQDKQTPKSAHKRLCKVKPYKYSSHCTSQTRSPPKSSPKSPSNLAHNKSDYYIYKRLNTDFHSALSSPIDPSISSLVCSVKGYINGLKDTIKMTEDLSTPTVIEMNAEDSMLLDIHKF
jgi:hypothetical protein